MNEYKKRLNTLNSVYEKELEKSKEYIISSNEKDKDKAIKKFHILIKVKEKYIEIKQEIEKELNEIKQKLDKNEQELTNNKIEINNLKIQKELLKQESEN